MSIVIPTYNESKNLPELITSLENILLERPHRIIIVDDNSPDGTARIAREMGQKSDNIIVKERLGKNGIGSAIRDGMGVAISIPECCTVITMDADLSHNPQEIIPLLKESEHADLVLASRYISGGQMIGWPFLRRVISRVANGICYLFLRTGVHENTSYFRAHSRRLAELIVRESNLGGFEFGINAILLAKDHNFVLREIASVFVERAQGKSKLRASDIVQWFVAISGIWFRRLLDTPALVKKEKRA